MSTINQIEANRENATRSTGPRSETGKEISSRNATRHGLTSRRIVLNSEEQPQFDQLLTGLLQEYDPQTQTERELVDEIADQSWRLRRASGIETDLFNEAAGDFKAISAELDKIRRYRTSIERAFHKAIEQLRKIKKDPARPQLTEEKLKQIRTQAIDSALQMILGAPLPGQGPESAMDFSDMEDEPEEDMEDEPEEDMEDGPEENMEDEPEENMEDEPEEDPADEPDEDHDDDPNADELPDDIDAQPIPAEEAA